MDAVMTDVPAQVLAERRALGLDRFDEVWDGVLHMVPAPGGEHQRFASDLLVVLHPLARATGLWVIMEGSLHDPDVPGHREYRVPDLVVFEPSLLTDRGVDGPADLVIEVRSPGDESFEKLPYFARLGVGEVLIIDRDTKAIRRWVNDGDDLLVECPPDERGRHVLDALPVEFWTDGPAVVVTHQGTDTRI